MVSITARSVLPGSKVAEGPRDGRLVSTWQPDRRITTSVSLDNFAQYRLIIGFITRLSLTASCCKSEVYPEDGLCCHFVPDHPSFVSWIGQCQFPHLGLLSKNRKTDRKASECWPCSPFFEIIPIPAPKAQERGIIGLHYVGIMPLIQPDIFWQAANW